VTGLWVAGVVALAVVAGLVVVRRRFTTATVRGTSMTPTFADGTRVLAARRAEYRPGEVIVFRIRRTARHDLRWRIKRVAAVPGDPVPSWMPDEAATVPPGHLLVTGDNPRSQDSRELGYIPYARIAGRVVRVLPHARRRRLPAS
jgi:signal peptidase I